MFENYFPNIDNSVRGMMAVSNESIWIGLGYPEYGYMYGIDPDTRVGYLTGRWVEDDGTIWVQVYFESAVEGRDGVKFNYGFINPQYFRKVTPNTIQGSKSLIEGLIDNNKAILENNLLCAGMMAYMEAKGTTVPVEYKKKLFALQSRLQARNEKLLNSPFLDAKKTASPVGFTKYESHLQNVMTDPGISIAPVVVYIVVSVVITLLTTSILYLIFKPDYTDSKADLKISSELAQALATLSPEARERVIADLEGQIDAAYIRGKTDGSGMGILKTVGYFAAGFIGFKLITNLIDKEKTK